MSKVRIASVSDRIARVRMGMETMKGVPQIAEKSDNAGIADSRGEINEAASVILTFDVEEHYRIESASALRVDADQIAYYSSRLDRSTHWLLELLQKTATKATFFVVGQVAKQNPRLVRAIAEQGHEIASHGWDHQRTHNFTSGSFRADVRRSLDVLEQITGASVWGYRAPTFSITPQTAWAIDVLAELGLMYDSSIYPVRHDRYGVRRAPRSPFHARGESRSILELPPATLSLLGLRLPMGGGGYFRLFPLFMTELAVRQLLRRQNPAAPNLYFHPWEFDPDQTRLPMSRLNRFRTYVGIRRTRDRLSRLLKNKQFCRAIDMARRLSSVKPDLTSFDVSAGFPPWVIEKARSAHSTVNSGFRP